MTQFSFNERKFLASLEECRIATSHDDMPHVKPVSYIFTNDVFYIATDYETRTYKNLCKNSHIALVVDIYKSGGHKAVCIQGKTAIIENGDRFLEIYAEFHKKFEWVRKEPWKENEAPFLEISPMRKVSWGLE